MQLDQPESKIVDAEQRRNPKSKPREGDAFGSLKRPTASLNNLASADRALSRQDKTYEGMARIQ